MVEKAMDKITVTLPRNIWNGIKGSLASVHQGTGYIWKEDAWRLVLALEVALQEAPNYGKVGEGHNDIQEQLLSQ